MDHQAVKAQINWVCNCASSLADFAANKLVLPGATWAKQQASYHGCFSLPKVKAAVLTACARYVWQWGILTLAACNSHSERPHWEAWLMGRASCLVAVLRAPQVWLVPFTFQKWHLLAYWDVTQDKPSYPHQRDGFHGVLHLAEQGACSKHSSSLFSLTLEARQLGTASLQLPGFAFLAPCGIMKSFLQAQRKCLEFLWEGIT